MIVTTALLTARVHMKPTRSRYHYKSFYTLMYIYWKNGMHIYGWNGMRFIRVQGKCEFDGSA